MPYPPPRTPSGPRRRSLLASAAGAALLVGCSAGPDSAAGNAPSAAARARARAARDSEGLLARYDAVLAAHPALARPLGPLRAQVAAHRAAFADRAAASPSAGSASPASGAASSPALAVPAGEKDALAFLATAERGLADRRAKELLDVPGELARLLASAAAAGAAHAYLLTEEAK
ncbi:hypothetical protein ACF1GY_27795 [Streptomyces sp. NPDC014684]|uniref:hypothetical protein n=1 Tax=unclassified Streptomyces TaxID=2593676 RepID=UPI001168F4F4|nr:MULTISPECIES: hypothetical protein [unclassified Streptomyces]MDI1457484.1 hypothetical protein [Streptomyces sp. ATE26]GEK04652.1 lipoprotein [Streptomyces sp. 1-11]